MISFFTVCGGMCWTALDRFFRAQPIDRRVGQPVQGDPLYDDIRQGQIETLRNEMWETITAWTQRSELDWFWQPESQGLLTQTVEWPKIKDSIDRGDPAIVCIIRADQAELPAANHQVIVYRYEAVPDHVVLWIYDPNYPGNDRVRIGFDLGKPKHKLSAFQTTGEKVRGLLLVPFRRNAAS